MCTCAKQTLVYVNMYAVAQRQNDFIKLEARSVDAEFIRLVQLTQVDLLVLHQSRSNRLAMYLYARAYVCVHVFVCRYSLSLTCASFSHSAPLPVFVKNIYLSSYGTSEHSVV